MILESRLTEASLTVPELTIAAMSFSERPPFEMLEGPLTEASPSQTLNN